MVISRPCKEDYGRSRANMQRAVLKSQDMQVFLSYSAADRRFAERLGNELRRRGLSVWSDRLLAPGSSWRTEIGKAIRSSDDILILVSPRDTDATQQFTWREALEAAWQDPRKRLIPVLLRGAQVPPFVYGDAAGEKAPLVEISDPQDLQSAAGAIVQALGQGGIDSGQGIQDIPVPQGVDSSTKGNQSYPLESYSHAVEEDRHERLQEIEQFAERLRK